MSGTVVQEGQPGNVTGAIEPTYSMDKTTGAVADPGPGSEFANPEVAYVYVTHAEGAALGITGEEQPTWTPPLPRTAPSSKTQTFQMSGREVYDGPNGGYWVRWWPDYPAFTYDEIFPPPPAVNVEFDDSRMYPHVSGYTATAQRPKRSNGNSVPNSADNHWHFAHKMSWIPPQQKSVLGNDVSIRDLQWAYGRAGDAASYRSFATIGATSHQPTGNPLLHSDVRPVAIDNAGTYKQSAGYTATSNATKLYGVVKARYAMNGVIHESRETIASEHSPMALAPQMKESAAPAVSGANFVAQRGMGTHFGQAASSILAKPTQDAGNGYTDAARALLAQFFAFPKANAIVGRDTGPIASFREDYAYFNPESDWVQIKGLGGNSNIGWTNARTYINPLTMPITSHGLTLTTHGATHRLYHPSNAPANSYVLWKVNAYTQQYRNAGYAEAGRKAYIGGRWAYQNMRTNLHLSGSHPEPFQANGDMYAPVWSGYAGSRIMMIANGNRNGAFMLFRYKVVGLYGGSVTLGSKYDVRVGATATTSAGSSGSTSHTRYEAAGRNHAGINTGIAYTRDGPKSGVRPVVISPLSNPGQFTASATQRISAVTFSIRSQPNVGPYSRTRSVLIQAAVPGGTFNTIAVVSSGSGINQTVTFGRQHGGMIYRIVPYGTGWQSNVSSSGPQMVVDSIAWTSGG